MQCCLVFANLISVDLVGVKIFLYFTRIGSPFCGRSYKITIACLFVYWFGIFLWNGSLFFFLIFCMVVENWNIKKLIEPFFRGKFVFVQIWEKRAQNGPQIMVFGMAWKILLVFLRKKLKWKLLLLLIFHPTVPYQANCLFSRYVPKCC